ncbi:Cof-type HAD-IIB family hydrolase [Sporolactobacillus sp. CQH2019]|uniref:Cof-type HAD-IIB family hydrolase n=1 Tax=Sporolactobacillus sp. CQH2019 TaxID=3023512 RepID=UPI002367874A|nr:Cof-type HAD-IIB family hydrolase [Sporolactobacillus sp. CQH2019]MDD9147198.1 Cof-type HAD-IIB family hydrolase [Sporolactobacillus sp. CQH2019]
MSEIKIVFFDIDDTLYDQDKKIPESTAEAIEKLQRKGIITAVATGRGPFMFADLRRQLNIHTFVSYNGSYVVHENEPALRNPLSRPILQELEKESSEIGNRLVFLNEQTMRIDGKKNDRVEKGIASLKLNFPFPEEDPGFYKQHDIYQALLFYSERDDSSYLRKEPLNTFRYVRWHPYGVDVIPNGGSKASGIGSILEKMNLSADEACAFGDGNNDVEMLSFVGTGVAMGNAVAGVKKAADFVTRPVNKDGVYYGLKNIGLL